MRNFQAKISCQIGTLSRNNRRRFEISPRSHAGKGRMRRPVPNVIRNRAGDSAPGDGAHAIVYIPISLCVPRFLP